MTQQALYRKWRSRSFTELIGQPHVVQTLKNAVETDRVAHAYIFSGPRGTGKTSAARILARMINCLAEGGERPCNDCAICRHITEGAFLDLIEIDAASNTQVDKVRDVIVEKVSFAPSEGRKKVYIIDEVHMLSNSAFNALLKTIEEPPPHAMFVLATTEIHKIPPTILSRCQRLDFRRIGVEEIVDHLAWVLEQEGIGAEPEVLDLVARLATGSMRDALSLLDQLLSHGGQRLTLTQARSALGLAAMEAVQALLDHLLAQNVAGALQLVNELLDQGTDPRQFLVDVLDQLRALLLTKAGSDRYLLNLPEEAVARLRNQATHLAPAALIEIIRIFNQAGADLKLGLQPQLPLELAIVESVLALQKREATPAPPPEERLASDGGAADDPKVDAPRPDDRATSISTETRGSTGNDAGTQTQRDEPPAEPGTPPGGEPRIAEEMATPAVSPPSASPPPPPPLPWEEEEFIPPPPAEVERGSEADSPVATDQGPVGDGEHTLDWWREQWEAFKRYLAQQGDNGQRITLRLNFCQPHSVDEEGLTLGFFYSLHLDKVQSPQERAVVERALTDFCGQPVQVKCVLTPKASPQEQAKTKYEAAAEDPVIQAALRAGARIIEVEQP